LKHVFTGVLDASSVELSSAVLSLSGGVVCVFDRGLIVWLATPRLAG